MSGWIAVTTAGLCGLIGLSSKPTWPSTPGGNASARFHMTTSSTRLAEPSANAHDARHEHCCWVTTVAPDSEVQTGVNATQIAVYKVNIALARQEVARGNHRGPIKLGMTGRAEIVTDRESILMIFVRKIRQSISLA